MNSHCLKSSNIFPTSERVDVAFFIPSLRGGGAERAMLLLAKSLSEQGISTEFIVSQATGSLLSEFPSGVPLIDLKKKKVMRCILPLASYLRTKKPKVLYSTVINANIATIIAKQLSGTDTKIVIRESNAPIKKAGDGLGNRLLYKLAPWIYQKADAVVAVSEGVLQQLAKLNPQLKPLLNVLPTPVVFQQMFEQANQSPEHPWFRSDNTVPIVLGVGRLHPQKDFVSLIKAVALIRRKMRLRLLILGEGPERAYLSKLAEQLGLAEDFSLPGFVSNPFSFMRAASVFVLSSAYEGMPNVLIQAMACGAKVVSTDCESGPHEVLHGGKYGALVPVGDETQMAKAIELALASPNDTTASEYARSEYSVERAVKMYLDLGLKKEHT